MADAACVPLHAAICVMPAGSLGVPCGASSFLSFIMALALACHTQCPACLHARVTCSALHPCLASSWLLLWLVIHIALPAWE